MVLINLCYTHADGRDIEWGALPPITFATADERVRMGEWVRWRMYVSGPRAGEWVLDPPAPL